MARHNNSNAVKTKHRIEMWWLHFQHDDFSSSKIKKWRRNHAGIWLYRPKHHCFRGEEHCKELVLSWGLSPKGSIADFIFSMSDFKRQSVPLESTLVELYEQCKMKMLRLYLYTKDSAPSSELSEDQHVFEQVCLNKNVKMCQPFWIEITWWTFHEWKN